MQRHYHLAKSAPAQRVKENYRSERRRGESSEIHAVGGKHGSQRWERRARGDQRFWFFQSILTPFDQNFNGVVQRLVAKEKQVLQLQQEVDRLKAQPHAVDREVHPLPLCDSIFNANVVQDDHMKRERDLSRAKWHMLNEEITKVELKVSRAAVLKSNYNTL